jgi:hypothetical protein
MMQSRPRRTSLPKRESKAKKRSSFVTHVKRDSEVRWKHYAERVKGVWKDMMLARMLAQVVLLLIIAVAQMSYAEDIPKTSLRSIDYGDRISSAAAELAKTRNQLRETTHEITTPIAIIVLSIDNIQTALFFQAAQLQNFAYVAPVKKTRQMYVSKTAETWNTFTSARIERGVNMIQKNSIHIADAGRLRLIEHARETIENAVELMGEAMALLETELGESKGL